MFWGGFLPGNREAFDEIFIWQLFSAFDLLSPKKKERIKLCSTNGVYEGHSQRAYNFN